MKFLNYIFLLLILYLIIRILKSIFSKKHKSNKKFKRLLKKFKKRKRRNPTKRELFRLVIDASHHTIKTRGKRGHDKRQKIRKYLLERYGIVRFYRVR